MMSDCTICGGTGRRVSREEHLPVTWADGTVITGSTSSTRACKCVRDLPEVQGEATWWDMETIFNEVFDIPIGCECGEVTVRAEVPRREDGRRVQMRGNRYYPTMVDVALPADFTVHSDDARKLAALLIRAADACDAVDDPCGAPCGHWHPCDCEASSTATSEAENG